MSKAQIKPKPANKPAPKALTAAERLAAIDVSTFCGRIAAGESQKAISDSIGVAASSMCEWIAADAERSARVREARAMSARHWDEQAERAILNADVQTAGSIAQARELASHYRWRASKYAPKEYGDKLAVGGSDDMPPIQQKFDVTMTPDEAFMRMIGKA